MSNNAHKKTPFTRYISTIAKDEFHAILALAYEHRYFAFALLTGLVAIVFYILNLSAGEIILASDQKTSSWYKLADKTRSAANAINSGYHFSIKDTVGTLDNAELLSDKSSKVNAAYLIPGALSDEINDQFYSLGSIDYEPIWVFYRKNIGKISSLKDLAKFRVGVGPRKSGRYILTSKLFKLNDVDISSNPLFASGTVSNQIKDFNEQKLDAVIFIGQPLDENVKRFAFNPEAELYDFEDAAAYTRNIAYFEKLTLPASSISISNKVPKKDISLLAITTTLAVRKDTPQNIQWALLLATRKSIDDAKDVFFGKRYEFPTYMDTTIKISPVAQQFYDKGAPALLGKVPFSFAVLIDRFWVVIISCLAILYPLSKIKFHFRQLDFALHERTLYVRLLEINKIINSPDATIAELELLKKELDNIIYESSLHKVPISEESAYFSSVRDVTALRESVKSKISENPINNG